MIEQITDFITNNPREILSCLQVIALFIAGRFKYYKTGVMLAITLIITILWGI